MGPLEIPEPLIILVAVYRPPTVIAFLSAYPDKAAYPLAFLPAPQPRGEKHLEVIIPQFFAEKVKILSGKTSRRTLPDPDVPLILLPWTPIGLVHGSAAHDFERDAAAINLKNVAV